MTDSGAYGKHLAAAFRLADAPTLLSRTSRDSTLAFTDLRVCPETSFRSLPIAREDAYLVCLYQSDHPRFQVWEDGKQISHGRVVNGETLILDLRKGPSVLVDRPFRAITFYLTRDALNEIADKSEAPRIAELDRTPAFGVADETVASLMQTVLAGFRQPEALGKLFVDHLGLALGTYIAQAYGGMKANSKALRGGLAPWQEKKIKDIVSARLGEEHSVSDLASECNLSHRHFCRAFRHSLGTSPHSYIQNSRVDHAKKLLTSTEMKLTDVGSACGFADQSHFTRVFTQFAGTTPGIWRRNSVPYERVEIPS